jgi:hypothetical protein
MKIKRLTKYLLLICQLYKVLLSKNLIKRKSSKYVLMKLIKNLMKRNLKWKKSFLKMLLNKKDTKINLISTTSLIKKLQMKNLKSMGMKLNKFKILLIH